MAQNNNSNNGPSKERDNVPKTTFGLSRFLSFRRSPTSVFRLSRIVSILSGSSRVNSDDTSTTTLVSTGQLLPYIQLSSMLEPSIDPLRKARWAVFSNFISYENNYMRTLHFLIYDCYGELIKDEVILERKKADEIFAYLPQIRALHQHFRSWVQKAALCWPEKDMVGWFFGALLEQPALLMVYARFVANYKQAITTLKQEFTRNRAFRNFLESRLIHANDRQHTFEEYFMRPIQRMIHFEMQISDMIQNTAIGHPDLPMLELCKKRVQHVVSHLDALEGHMGSLRGLMKITFPGRLPLAPYAAKWHETRLLRCENLTIATADRWGETLENICPLYLMADRVLLTVVDERTPKDRFEGKLNLKWMLPLQEIELQIVSADGTKPIYEMDAVEPYSTMLRLMLDFATVAEIETLVSHLSNSFQGLNTAVTTNIMHKFTIKMQKINESAKEAEECYNSTGLLVETKGDGYYAGNGRKYMLWFADAVAKRNWYCNARLAQRAMKTALHSPVWWVHEDQLFATYEPVFRKKFSPITSIQTSKISTGCYYEPNISGPLYTKLPLQDWLRNRNSLWISTFDGINSIVTLYTHDLLNQTLQQRAHFTLKGTYVECIEHVPVGKIIYSDDATIDTVWMGMHNQLSIYSGSYPLVDEALVTVPIIGDPMRMLYIKDRMYIGMSNGNVLVYRMHKDKWNVFMPLVVSVSDAPIVAMLNIKDDVYVATGSAVIVIDGRTDQVGEIINRTVDLKDEEEKEKEVEATNCNPITLMGYSVNGMWLVRHQSSIISLYHLSPWKHLQDIDVATHVLDFVPHTAREFFRASVYITALMLVDDSLWVGTNVGLTLMMVLPMRRNVPLIADFMYAAKHAHLQEVNFLLPLLPASRLAVGGYDESDYDAFDFSSPGDDIDDETYQSGENEDEDNSSCTYMSAQSDVIIEPTNGDGERVDHPEPTSSKTGTIPKSPSAGKNTPGIYETKRLLNWPTSNTGTLVVSENSTSKHNVMRGSEKEPASKTPTVVVDPAYPATVLIIAGGEGYINWHNWEAKATTATGTGSLPSTSSNSADETALEQSHDKFPCAQIVLWEKRLNRPFY